MRLAILALTATTASAFLLPARLVSTPKVGPLRAASVEPTSDIVDTAVAAGSFKTLATALQAAGLVDTLKSSGPFTVFAPTDEAFAKIPQETLAAILADKEKLTSILTYHVVAGKVPAADVIKMTSATTVQGSAAKIALVNGAVKVDGATVVSTDVAASNGIIHVIDTVLIPPAAPAAFTPKKVGNDLATREVLEAGATAPFGRPGMGNFFDPLGLSQGKTVKELKKWRESELKHGRVAMLAIVGVLVQEVFAPFYSSEAAEFGLSADPGPAIIQFQEMEKVDPIVLIFLILGIAVAESFTISKGWDSIDETRAQGTDIAGLKDTYITGDYEFDPMGLAPRTDVDKFLSMRSKELNNGRLAMIAWIGAVVQELVTGHKLF